MLFVGLFLSNERNRAAFGSTGNIEVGKKFGVAVGDIREDAILHLKKLGLETAIFPNRQSCLGIIYDEDIRINILQDNSWRQGTVCIASKNEIVISLSWHYSFFQI